ncbi:MAG: ferrous iron transporter B [Oligoflexia bacterium]|nr:MAG: ferrous iron transporter B [Oligoflexia bacterium]
MGELIALVGAPNSGKTTLYNWLTNSKFKTVNYPGATVEYSIGAMIPELGPSKDVMDTPGTYSLFPKSADEVVTYRALYESHEDRRVSKIILVMDGTQLDRHFILASQLKAAGFTFVIVVTMDDLLRSHSIQLNTKVIQDYFQVPVVLFNGITGDGLEKIVEVLDQQMTKVPELIKPWSETQIAHEVSVAKTVVQKALSKSTETIYEKTARYDRYLLHPIFGLGLFFLIMATLFTSIYWVATPFMDAIDAGFSALAEMTGQYLGEGLFSQFLSDGVIAGFGAVLVFVPQIFILFFGIGILESTGYLARAATLIDKPFSLLGLSGRSFVPVLSGFACAVPAIMATRNLSSNRDRMITNFIIPLMTCSARLPVYALLLGFLFHNQPAWKAGMSLAALYFGALVIGSIAAGILNKILARSQTSFFMMELPLYRQPRWKMLVHQTLSRTKSYVVRAGPVIFIFSALIWAGSTFPNPDAPTLTERMQTSYLGQVGQVIEPVFEPMGLDWRVGIGLMSAFAAREVFVSSMAIVFNVTDTNEDTQSESLLKVMSEAKKSDGSLLFTTASLVSLIVFFMIALQCMSTFAIAAKESQSFQFALTQLVVLNVVAYILSVLIYRGLSALVY